VRRSPQARVGLLWDHACRRYSGPHPQQPGGALQNGHPDEEEEREKGVVVFSTDSRPLKRRKAQTDRQSDRKIQQQVCTYHAYDLHMYSVSCQVA
jgi:hypothetical protein